MIRRRPERRRVLVRRAGTCLDQVLDGRCHFLPGRHRCRRLRGDSGSRHALRMGAMSSIEQTRTTMPVTGSTTRRLVPDEDAPVVKAPDRWLITGAVLAGSLLLSPIGLVVIAIGFLKSARAKASGEFVRLAAVTLFGMFAMV